QTASNDHGTISSLWACSLPGAQNPNHNPFFYFFIQTPKYPNFPPLFFYISSNIVFSSPFLLLHCLCLLFLPSNSAQIHDLLFRLLASPHSLQVAAEDWLRSSAIEDLLGSSAAQGKLCSSAIVRWLRSSSAEDLLRSSAAQGKLCSSIVVHKFVTHCFNLQQVCPPPFPGSSHIVLLTTIFDSMNECSLDGTDNRSNTMDIIEFYRFRNELLVYEMAMMSAIQEAQKDNGVHPLDVIADEHITQGKMMAIVTVFQFSDLIDKSSLIWISSKGERSLKLASISRITPGQRTYTLLLNPFFDISRYAIVQYTDLLII
uniref:Uncharacterized protein n=1 Tax=Cucumis melo TaxID=3656 RepID=A0A9I9EG12_CUCME